MCYYATIDYRCGDWKWGNMMLRCPRQHRIGETCGAKLVHHESITKSASICKICEELTTKQRRLSKTRDNISRWSREPEKFSASLDKAKREAEELAEKVKDLHLRRSSVATTINSAAKSAGSGRDGSTAAAAATTLPPLTSMSTPASPGYEYTSIPGLNRRQENSAQSVPRNGVLPGVGNAGGISFASGPMTSQYANLPGGNYVSRNGTTINGASANVPLNRQSGAYMVSYARR